MKAYIYIFTALHILMCLGCKKANRVPKQEPAVFVSNEVLLADGKSYAEVELNFDTELAPNQSVEISISNGLLYKYPMVSTDEGSASLTLLPNQNQARFLIQSSRKVDANVVLTVKLNDFIVTKNLIFKRVCPDEVFLYTNNNELSVGSNEEATLTVVLYKSESHPSLDTRVDFKVDTSPHGGDLLINYPQYNTSSDSLQLTVSPLDTNTGIVNVIAFVNGSCDSIGVSIPIKIVN